MSLDALEAFLRRTTGLDAATVSAAAVERSVRSRMAACRVDDPDRYLDLVQSSPDEFQELVEAVIVPETWFFRDRESFAALARLAAETWPTVRPGGTFRLLSLPCSTGEEPYSMAMTLLDAGLAPGRFRVDGIDISRRSLEQARGGVYGRNSFRGDDLGFRARHFRQEPSGWRVHEGVQEPVRFEPGNLVDANLLPGSGTYDVVFCRNVLIYFDAEARQRVVGTLERLLAPDGLLFMGASESGILPDNRFVSARLPHTFAFRKGSSASSPLPAAPAARKAARPMPVPLPPKAAPGPGPAAPRPGPPVPAAPIPEERLDEALRLADQGRLAEAAARCEEHLREHGPSARAYSLLGLVRDAERNHAEAIALYRKALYLDPRNGEILVHLASLLESGGQAKEAQLLHERARRVGGSAK